jgi:hypothetical protein
MPAGRVSRNIICATHDSPRLTVRARPLRSPPGRRDLAASPTVEGRQATVEGKPAPSRVGSHRAGPAVPWGPGAQGGGRCLQGRRPGGGARWSTLEHGAVRGLWRAPHRQPSPPLAFSLPTFFFPFLQYLHSRRRMRRADRPQNAGWPRVPQYYLRDSRLTTTHGAGAPPAQPTHFADLPTLDGRSAYPRRSSCLPSTPNARRPSNRKNPPPPHAPSVRPPPLPTLGAFLPTLDAFLRTLDAAWRALDAARPTLDAARPPRPSQQPGASSQGPAAYPAAHSSPPSSPSSKPPATKAPPRPAPPRLQKRPPSTPARRPPPSSQREARVAGASAPPPLCGCAQASRTAANTPRAGGLRVSP